MKFEKVKIDEVRKRHSGEAYRIISEFANAGIHAAEVLEWETRYCDISSCVATLCKCAKNHGMTHIHSFMRKTKVYLINDLIEEDEA